MKKILKIIFVTFLCLFISGCGKEVKELECNYSGDNFYSDIDVKLNAIFSGNEIIKISTISTYTVKENYMDEIDSYVDSQKKQYNISSDEGINFDVTSDGNKIYVKLNYDLRSMSDDIKKKYDMENVYGDYDMTKNLLEDSGYLCK